MQIKLSNNGLNAFEDLLSKTMDSLHKLYQKPLNPCNANNNPFFINYGTNVNDD